MNLVTHYVDIELPPLSLSSRLELSGLYIVLLCYLLCWLASLCVEYCVGEWAEIGQPQPKPRPSHHQIDQAFPLFLCTTLKNGGNGQLYGPCLHCMAVQLSLAALCGFSGHFFSA